MRRERGRPAHLRMKISFPLSPAYSTDQAQEKGAHGDLKHKWHNHKESQDSLPNCGLFILKTS